MLAMNESLFFFLMIRQPPRSTRTDTLFPYTTLFLSCPLHAALLDPLLRRVVVRHDDPGLQAQADQAVERQARLDPAGQLRPEVEEVAVEQDQAVVRIEDGEAFGDAVDRVLEPALRGPAGDDRLAQLAVGPLDGARSEERRVGKECVRKCKFEGGP